MRTRSRKSLSQQSGQSLVELAISLTVLMLLLSGAVTFGMALFSYVSLRDAAQEGALYGSFNPCILESDGTCHRDSAINRNAILARIRASSTSPINFANTALVPDAYITTTLPTGQPCEGSNSSGIPNAIQVSVRYDYPIFMPFMSAIIGRDNIPLTGIVTDTILEPRCPPPAP